MWIIWVCLFRGSRSMAFGRSTACSEKKTKQAICACLLSEILGVGWKQVSKAVSSPVNVFRLDAEDSCWLTDAQMSKTFRKDNALCELQPKLGYIKTFAVFSVFYCTEFIRFIKFAFWLLTHLEFKFIRQLYWLRKDGSKAAKNRNEKQWTYHHAEIT